MARPGVVDADAGRGAKAGAERRVVLGAERVQPGGQEPHHLALRDRKARGRQQGHDPLAGHLALKMQDQNQATQMRAAAAHDARRKIGRHRPPVRRRPALAPVERHLRPERDILNDDLLVALVARTRRRRRRQPHRRSMLSFDTPGPRRRGGGLSAAFGRSAAARSVAFSIPDGLNGGRGGRPFRRRISSFSVWFSAREAVSAAFSLLDLPPKPLDLADQSANQPSQFGRAQTLKRINRAGRHPQLKSYFPALDSPLRPGICPGYAFRSAFARPPHLRRGAGKEPGPIGNQV